MPWFQELDTKLFRAINIGLQHPWLDATMPLFAWNAFFVPCLIVLGIGLLWKGGRRGRIFVFVLALVLGLGDAFVINTIKDAVARPRPFNDVPDLKLLVGYGRSGSMPSSHTATWFAGMLLAYAFYWRTIFFMLPLALVMAFSRVYVGAHYPSDVLAGALLGLGYAAFGLMVLQSLWRTCGPSWFAEWYQQTPVLARAATGTTRVEPARLSEKAYLRLGYLAISVVLVARLIYIASGKIELSEDEAYQWLWSKHLALSYYSKPPLIAYAQWLGTYLWGDTEFGVRFLSPVIAAVLSWILLQFFARHSTASAGFWLVLILNCTPLLAVGSTLLTVDPLLVLFWTAAMVAGWSAVQPTGVGSKTGHAGHWLLVGLFLGLGFLSKYTAALQIICFAVFFIAYPPARKHLLKPGPILALAVCALATVPVIVWNSEHQWITVEHVASNARRAEPWEPTLKFFLEFLGSEFALLNPVFFLGMILAIFGFWRAAGHSPLRLYCFCMGAPVFFGYMAFSLYKRVFPNWIAASVVPLFCLMVLYWRQWVIEGSLVPKRGLAVGLGIGVFAVILLHETDLTRKVFNRTLPPTIDPLRRVRSWSEAAKRVTQAREEFLREGKPVFVVADHYGLASQLSFYMPEAKTAAQNRDMLVYYKTSTTPKNQFYFWPGYRLQRRGQNAILVKEVDPPKLVKGWFWKWVAGEKDLYSSEPLRESVIGSELRAEFDSIEDAGVHEIKYRGRVFRRVHLFRCRNLR